MTNEQKTGITYISFLLNEYSLAIATSTRKMKMTNLWHLDVITSSNDNLRHEMKYNLYILTYNFYFYSIFCIFTENHKILIFFLHKVEKLQKQMHGK